VHDEGKSVGAAARDLDLTESSWRTCDAATTDRPDPGHGVPARAVCRSFRTCS
jgi:hypothetical protein